MPPYTEVPSVYLVFTFLTMASPFSLTLLIFSGRIIPPDDNPEALPRPAR